MGFQGMVFIVFLILKLAEVGVVANWSWLWVTSPLWIPIALILAIFILISPFLIFLYFRKKKIKRIMSETGMNHCAAVKKAKESEFMKRLRETRGINK